MTGTADWPAGVGHPAENTWMGCDGSRPLAGCFFFAQCALKHNELLHFQQDCGVACHSAVTAPPSPTLSPSLSLPHSALGMELIAPSE